MPAESAVPRRPESRVRSEGPSAGEGKLGEVIARRIEREVIAAGWQVGSNVGSEAELIGRYGVSRSVMREAMRLLEYLGVARMRRGPGGGLIVTRPDPSAVINAVLAYMTFERVSLDEVLGARRAIEEAAAGLAARRRTMWINGEERPVTGKRPVGALESEAEFHRGVAEMTENPALELFVEILGRVSSQFQPSTRMLTTRLRVATRQLDEVHEGILAAIAAGDDEGAVRRMGRHLDGLRTVLTDRQRSYTLGFGEIEAADNGHGPLAREVARRIYSEVVAKGWPVGQVLGGEVELMARHRVGRPTLREALRLLEFVGVVVTRRGSGGGVVVTAPSQSATVQALASYIESRGITPQHMFEVRRTLELAAVDLAVTRIDAKGEALLRDALEREGLGELKFTAQALHVRIAEITGNRVIHLFLYALTRLVEQHIRDDLPVTEQEAQDSVRIIHRAIVDAIVAGDRELARRRMSGHLAALMPHQR